MNLMQILFPVISKAIMLKSPAWNYLTFPYSDSHQICCPLITWHFFKEQIWKRAKVISLLLSIATKYILVSLQNTVCINKNQQLGFNIKIILSTLLMVGDKEELEMLKLGLVSGGWNSKLESCWQFWSLRKRRGNSGSEMSSLVVEPVK